MLKKMCCGCLNRFDIDRLNFYPVPAGSNYSGKYLAACDVCAPSMAKFGAPVRREMAAA